MIEPERLQYIRWLAARFLLYQRRLSPVIDVRRMELPHNVFIASFTEYANATGVARHILTGGGVLEDGYMIRRKDSCIVLYSESYDILCPQRLRFSLAHELGHIFLHHRSDDVRSEEEANAFAAQTVAHDILALPLIRGGYGGDVERIREQFGLSWEAAAIKLRRLNRNPRAYSADEWTLCRKYFADCPSGADNCQKFAAAQSAAFVSYEE